MQISLNGPAIKSEECSQLLSDAALIWRKTHVRNLPPMKQLPCVGGSAHTDNFYPTVTVECGNQTDLESMIFSIFNPR
ncbi:hypothetical protein DPMN_153064 [Dreissena polymorpha]|uniref:Uncharacterized protein n=1 Tax=Dreissena polymorpha TaxID=45954 RepID=A0A9D4FK28_DREPO|nr:hypothetical protein DPMN_153064 [Dreissena polymorpha]